MSYQKDLLIIWLDITSRPKWYAGIKTKNGSFYTAQSAKHLKDSFYKNTLSEYIIEKVLNAHGYFLQKSWVKRSEDV